MSTSTLANKIKIARKEANLSQTELSKALLVSEKAVSSYESGRTKPTLETIERIAKKTNKPIWYFTNEDNKELSILAKLNTIQMQLDEIRGLLKEDLK